MTPDEYRLFNLQVVVMCNTLAVLPLVDMLAAQARAEAVGPVMDPTLYRERQAAFRIDMERTRILRKAQVALDRLKASA